MAPLLPHLPAADHADDSGACPAVQPNQAPLARRRACPAPAPTVPRRRETRCRAPDVARLRAGFHRLERSAGQRSCGRTEPAPSQPRSGRPGAFRTLNGRHLERAPDSAPERRARGCRRAGVARAAAKSPKLREARALRLQVRGGARQVGQPWAALSARRHRAASRRRDVRPSVAPQRRERLPLSPDAPAAGGLVALDSPLGHCRDPATEVVQPWADQTTAVTEQAAARAAVKQAAAAAPKPRSEVAAAVPRPSRREPRQATTWRPRRCCLSLTRARQRL